jgi:hypothetical protein
MTMMSDQNKDLAVLEVRIGIPVKGFNAVGQARLIEETVENLRNAVARERGVVVLDRIELA